MIYLIHPSISLYDLLPNNIDLPKQGVQIWIEPVSAGHRLSWRQFYLECSVGRLVIRSLLGMVGEAVTAGQPQLALEGRPGLVLLKG